MEWCFAAALPAALAVRRPRNRLGSPALPAAERGNRPPAAVFPGPARRRRVHSAVRQGQKRVEADVTKKALGRATSDEFNPVMWAEKWHLVGIHVK